MRTRRFFQSRIKSRSETNNPDFVKTRSARSFPAPQAPQRLNAFLIAAYGSHQSDPCHIRHHLRLGRAAVGWWNIAQTLAAVWRKRGDFLRLALPARDPLAASQTIL
jgi:hypothetical protein